MARPNLRPQRLEADNLDALDDTGKQVLAVEVKELPLVFHGFQVRIFIGPYPIDASRSHRRSVYCELIPSDETAKAICPPPGVIRSMIPLTAEGAAQLAADPDGALGERVRKDVLAAAAAELQKRERKVMR